MSVNGPSDTVQANNFLERLVRVEPGEWPRLAIAFFYFFFLLGGYFMLLAATVPRIGRNMK